MKGSHDFSILQGKSKACFLSGAFGVPLEKHHIYFGRGKRAISDKHGFWVWLLPMWHRGTYGVHGKEGKNIDLLLKRDCQRAYEEEWLNHHPEASPQDARAAFVEIIKKNYLEEWSGLRGDLIDE